MQGKLRALLLVVVAALFVPVITAGQQQPVPDETPLVGFRGKPRLFLTLDRTSSFVSGKAATTNEIRAGLEFKKKLRLGIGWAKLTSDVVSQKDIVTEVTQLDSVVNAELSLSYWTLSGEYTFYDSKRWQITVPAFVGIGSSYFYYYEKIDGDYREKRTDEERVMLTGISGVVTFRIFRWIGVSGGLGFRRLVVDNSRITESFNSPVYLFRVRIFIGEIYKTAFPRGITGKRNPPYSNEFWD